MAICCITIVPSGRATASHLGRRKERLVAWGFSSLFRCLPISNKGDMQNFSGQAVLSSRPHLRVEARRHPTRTESAKVRNLRLRKKFNGTAKLPRLSIFRSRKHVYAQLVDDARKHTLVAASTNQFVDFEHMETSLSPIEDAAKQVGCEIARRCLEIGILKVVLDRNGFSGRGGIQALADAVQENGILYS